MGVWKENVLLISFCSSAHAPPPEPDIGPWVTLRVITSSLLLLKTGINLFVRLYCSQCLTRNHTVDIILIYKIHCIIKYGIEYIGNGPSVQEWAGEISEWVSVISPTKGKQTSLSIDSAWAGGVTYIKDLFYLFYFVCVYAVSVFPSPRDSSTNCHALEEGSLVQWSVTVW